MPKTLERVQNPKKPAKTALDSLWHAYLQATTENPSSPLKTLPTPQKSAHVCVYFLLIIVKKRPEISADSAELVQTLDYYPFGGTRIDNQYNNFSEKRQFTGYEKDYSTGLNYAGARYQNPDQGRFISQDPAHIFVGDQKFRERYNRELETHLVNPQLLNSARTMGGSNSGFASGWNRNTQSRGNSISQIEWLADPQMQNSYAYARGNPITMKDPNGEAGVFFQADLSGNAGMGAGFAGTVSGGAGLTWGDGEVEYGGYGSYGGLAGGAFHSTTVEGSRSGPNPYTVAGLSGGPGIGLTFTNATRVSQVALPTVTNNLTAGIASFSWSRDAKSGVWTVTMSIGGKPGLSFSSYPTNTTTVTAGTTEKKTDNSKKKSP